MPDSVLPPPVIELPSLRHRPPSPPPRELDLPHSASDNMDVEIPPTPPVTGSPHAAVTTSNAFGELKTLRSRLQYACICILFFQSGWNDGSNGPLLPRIQSVYAIGFTVVSMIFIVACCGYLTGVLLNVSVTDKFGFGKVVVLGALLQAAGFTVQATAPPFPVFAASYFLNGLGGALIQAQGSGFVTSMPNAPPKLGVLHASYGLGAVSAPLSATQFSTMPRWSFFYLCGLGLSLLNFVCSSLAFKGKTQADIFVQMELPPNETDPNSSTDSKLKQIIRMKAVHVFAFFALSYVGIEVTIGGWIVTFIEDVRGGGPSSGYISAGFFGGLTAGRLLLLWVTRKLGEYRAILLYGFLAMCLELVVWFAPSLLSNALAVSFVGLFLGPMYPIMMNRSGKVFPRWLLTPCIGWIAGFGMAGSALIPFASGALSGKFGIKALQPFIVGMMCLMMALWFLSPKFERRED